MLLHIQRHLRVHFMQLHGTKRKRTGKGRSKIIFFFCIKSHRIQGRIKMVQVKANRILVRRRKYERDKRKKEQKRKISTRKLRRKKKFLLRSFVTSKGNFLFCSLINNLKRKIHHQKKENKVKNKL